MGWFVRTTPFFCDNFVHNQYNIVEGGIIMEKNDIAPVLGYEEFKKEDLKEAGVVFNYTDDEFTDCTKDNKNEAKRQGFWFSYFMFLFLVFSFLLIIVVGSWRISNRQGQIQDVSVACLMNKEGV